MTFADFLSKYFSNCQIAEIKKLITNLSIYREIESSINDFFFSLNTKNRNEIITHFVLTCRDFVTTIYNSLLSIQPGNFRARIVNLITPFFKKLLLHSYTLSGLKLLDYLSLIKSTIKLTCQKYAWDSSVIEKHIFYNYTDTILEEKKTVYRTENTRCSAPVNLKWQGKKQLDLFIDDLMKLFRSLKSKKALYNLFDEIKTDFKIKLPSKDLLAFLTLFHCLHENETIKVAGNRGLFVYLQQHLEAPPKDIYPKRDFRKLRYEGEKDDKVKAIITAMISPLLAKHGVKKDSSTPSTPKIY